MYENAGPKAKDVRVDMISRVKWFNLRDISIIFISTTIKECD